MTRPDFTQANAEAKQSIAAADRAVERAGKPAPIRIGTHTLYPITSDDGQRMWASVPEPEATALDVVYDSDEALIEGLRAADQPASTAGHIKRQMDNAPKHVRDSLNAACEYFGGNQAATEQPDIPVHVKRSAEQLNAQHWREMVDLHEEVERLKAKLAEVEAIAEKLDCEKAQETAAVLQVKQRAEAAEQKLAEVEAELETAYKTVDDNWVSHKQLIHDRQRAEAAERRAEEAEGKVVELTAIVNSTLLDLEVANEVVESRGNDKEPGQIKRALRILNEMIDDPSKAIGRMASAGFIEAITENNAQRGWIKNDAASGNWNAIKPPEAKGA